MRRISLLISTIAVSLVLAACNKSATDSMMASPSPAADAMEQTGATTMEDAATSGMVDDGSTADMMADTGEVRKLTIDTFKFAFSEEEIRVKAGETVELTLTNSDGMHDFVIDELNVKTKQINAGQTDTVTFTVPADAKGKTYEYYCSVMNHREMGMVGKLIVE